MKQLVTTGLAAAILFAALPVPAGAQDTVSAQVENDETSPLHERAEQIVALVNGELEPQEVFTDGFLRAVPPEQFKSIAAQLTSQFGRAISVESLDPPGANRASLSIRMERTIAHGGIAIDPSNENRVSELLFQTFDPLDDDLDKIEADLAALPGEVTWWFGPIDAQSLATSSSGVDDQMPIGSTFKLYVLATLAREIADGKRAWSDTVTLGENRSFPSGMIHDWPENAPLTLQTLASLMISISDNTATDALIDELGRDAIMQTMIESDHAHPELNDPFLKTREMFLLKAGPQGRLHTYQRSDAGVRQQILEGIEDVTVPRDEVASTFAGPPIALDVEWFASARDITKLMKYLLETGDQEALAIMAINTSMPLKLRDNYSYVGYKGGSEPGVLNLSWLLTDHTGRDHALILSWRNDDLRFDPAALELIAQRMLLSLDREPTQ